jgi:hypothetical protein
MLKFPMLAGYPSFRERRPLLVRSFLATFVGGATGWSALFAGLTWGLATGVALTLVVIGLRPWRAQAYELRYMLSFVPAFALLTWPALYVCIGLIRYWLTGEALGE